MSRAAIAIALCAAAAGCGRDGAGAREGGASVPVPWQPPGVSSPAFESHPAFDPLNGDLYFVRSSPRFEGWRILVSRCGADGLRRVPVSPPFAGPGVEADPVFADGGRTLWYISTRARGTSASADLDIWRVERGHEGAWGAPQRLPEPINSVEAEWFPRPSPDGWLYFGSARPGGHGGNDIWRARSSSGTWVAENLGPIVNSQAHEYEPMPSADGRRLLVAAEGGFFETEKAADGWSARRRMPAALNQNGTEIGALASPGGSLLFGRDTRGPLSGELFLWRRGGDEAWPPPCPAARAR